MKKLISIIVLSLTGVYAQVLQVTPSGMLPVKDSISNTPIVPDTFTNFRDKLMYPITNDKDWMKKNAGKYLVPKIEENQYLVLKKRSGWGVINLQGDIFIPFEETSPVYLFRKATCYGARVTERSGVYNRLNKNNSYLGSFTILDLEGNIISSYAGMVDEFKGSCIVYDQSSEKYGIINSVIDTVAEFKYTCTSWDDKNFGFSDRGFVALKNPDKKCGIISYKGKTVMPFAYDFIDDLVFPTALINMGEKWGLLNNKDLRIKVPIKYEDIQCSSNGIRGDYFTAFAKDSTGYDVYDSAFKLMGHYDFEDFGYTRDPNLVEVKAKGKYGLYNFIQNKFVFPPVYESIDYWCGKDCEKDGKYILATGDSVFVLNSSAKVFARHKGVQLKSLFSAGYSALQLEDGRFQLLKNFEPISNELYDALEDVFINMNQPIQHFIVKKNGLYGICDTLGKTLLDYQYDHLSYDRLQSYYLFIAERNNALDFYDKNLSLINNKPFEIFTDWWKPYLKEDLTYDVVRCENLYGIFDFKLRQFLINPAYKDIKYVEDYDYSAKSKGYYLNFLNDGSVSLINNGKVIFTAAGEMIRPTYDPERYIVVNKGKSYMTDLTGKIVSKGYDSLAYVGNDSQLLVVKNKCKYGIMTLDEKMIYPVKYTRFCNNADNYKNYSYAFMLALPKEAIYVDNFGVVIRTEKDDYWFNCRTDYY